MGGWEVVGGEEQDSLNLIFEDNGGVAFAHGFAGIRKRYFVREAEALLAGKLKVSHCQMVSSGSAGLYCALKALGIGPGDEVITSAFTFIATIEAIMLTGATPIPVDIDETFNMDTIQIEDAITKKTRAILPVHMAGSSADMDAIMKIAEAYRLFVVEDACQALGAKWFGENCGTIGHIGVFSFDGGKVIQCGEGGAVVTNRRDLYERIRAIHDHGHDYSLPNDRAGEVPWMPGFNFRMTELQAAYLIPQIKKLDFILGCQKANKSLLSDIKESRKFKSPGEAGDSLILTFPTREDAQEVVRRFRMIGVPIKNIPDALNWHFAGYWMHIFPENKWWITEDLLLRSVCIGIPVINSAMKFSPDQIIDVQGELW